MKTVVFQSFRTSNVPDWLARCLQSVREWASIQGFDYRFVDDRLFEYAPDWYRQRVKNHVLPVSDLARLVLARELLGQGYQRAIWMDADVLVFAPERLRIEISREYAFCREVWTFLGDNGHPHFKVGVNNAVCVFVQPNSLLDFYIHACQSLMSNKPKPDQLSVGTHFLTELDKLMCLPQIMDVGLFSPLLMADIARGTTKYLKAYLAYHGSRLHAANLCLSWGGQTYDGIEVGDQLFEAVIDNLLHSRGAELNQIVDQLQSARR